MKKRRDFNKMITNINGLDVKIIKEVLTNVEVDYIVKTVVDIYFEKEDFENIPYSPLTARTNFYSLLFQLCVEDYDGEDIKKYNELYEHDVQGYILSEIRNASEAKKLIEELQLVYNKTRQAGITKEITEIVGGAAAVS